MREDDADAHDADEPSAYVAFRDGDELLASGNPHAAIVALERARELEPEQASVRETLARAYFQAARFGAAAAEFATAIELDPVNDYAHFGLGLALQRTGDVVGARRHLRIATVMRPDNVDYQHALAAVAVDDTAPSDPPDPSDPSDPS
jgi:Flp pilus assembly protein TadD